MPKKNTGPVTDNEPTYPIADLDDDQEREDVSGNSPAEDEGLDRVIEWWQLDFDAKQAIADEFEQIYMLYNDRHWDMNGPDGGALRTEDEMAGRPNVVENVSFPLVEGMKAEFSQDVELIDYPQEPSDDHAARVMTQLKRYILDKNAFPVEYAKFRNNWAWYGTGIWGPRWDPEWKGGRGPNRWIGDVRVESVHPSMIFPDHRCGENIQDGFRIHKAVWRPLEYIRQHYPERGHLVVDHAKLSDATGNATAWELAEDDVGTAQEGMARLVETWYRGKPLFPSKDSQVDDASAAQGVDGDTGGLEVEGAGKQPGVALQPPAMDGPMAGLPMVAPDAIPQGSPRARAEEQQPSDDDEGLHVVWWIADQNLYLAHRNHMYFDPDESTDLPFVFAKDYEREDSPWGYGEGHKLIDPQQKLNKLSEIAMEGAALQALGFTLAPEEAVTEEQRRDIELYGSIPGMWFFVDDPTNIRHIDGQGVPGAVLNDIARRTKHMETLIGRYDITQGKTPSGVTAFRALNLLAERAQVRLRPKEQAIEQSLIALSKWISRLVMLYYDEPRAYRIIGKNGERIEYGIFKPASMWRVWDRRTGNTFERDRFIPGPGMVEGEDFEFFAPVFDSRCTVSKAEATDRYFAMDLAKEMVQGKLFPPEVLFYAMEHGRLPPWDTIREKVQPQFDKAQAMQQPGAQVALPPGQGAQQPQPQVTTGFAGQGEVTPEALLQMLPPEQQAELATLPPDQQQEVLMEMLATLQGGG